MVNELPQDCAHVVSKPHMGHEAVRALTGILEATTPDSRLQVTVTASSGEATVDSEDLESLPIGQRVGGNSQRLSNMLEPRAPAHALNRK